MLGSHSVKIFDARIKQQSLIADITAEIPHHLVSSKTTQLRKKYWNLPVNAADLKKEFTDIKVRIPDFSSGVTQVLLPYRNNYIAVAPVPSAGLIHEVYQRLQEQRCSSKFWTIQPTPQAIGNHGEVLLKQGGRIRMFRAFTRQPKKDIPVDDVALRFKVYRANVSSGLVSCGMPSIAAVGGLVHSIEREFGAPIQFAVGYRDIEVSDSATLSSQRTSSKGVRKVLVTSEVTATIEVTLMLRSEKDGLREHMANKIINRFAGGAVFDYRLANSVNARFLQSVKVNSKKRDILDAAITLYKLGLRRNKTPHTVLHSGYAFLEQPKNRECARNGNLSAWAEPVFSIVKLVDFDDSCWFSRKEKDGLVYWEVG